jgi:hypothetical protein
MSLSRKAIQRCLCALVIASIVCSLSCGDCVETPSIASITPTSAVAASQGFVLVVNGSNFQRDSAVEWNNSTRATIFVNSHKLNATILPGDVATPGTATVTVFSPPQSQPVTLGTSSTSSTGGFFKADCAGGTSNSHAFTVNP